MGPPRFADGGGLDAIPTDEGMFTGDFTGGGIVAFAGGREVPYGPEYEKSIFNFVPGARITSGYRSPEHNKKVGGKPNSYHLTDNARDVVPPPGMPMWQLYKNLRGKFGEDVRLINEGDHIHVQPNRGGHKDASQGKNWWGGASRTGGLGSIPLPEETPPDYVKTDTDFGSNLAKAENLMGGFQNEDRDQYRADLRAELDPENQKKEKEQDMWMALAQFGGSLATTPGPFLAALGSSLTKTLPDITASAKERKAAKREAMKGLMELEGMDRKEALETVNFGVELWKTELELDSRNQLLAERIAERKQRMFEGAADRTSRENIAAAGETGATNRAVINAGAPGNDLQLAAALAGGKPTPETVREVIASKGGAGGKDSYNEYFYKRLAEFGPNPTPEQRLQASQEAEAYARAALGGGAPAASKFSPDQFSVVR